jgi:hypothetical protein
MSYLGGSLICVWIVGILCLEGLYLNDIRRVNNNYVAGALQAAPIYRLGSDLFLHFRFLRIDSALLTEAGRAYRTSAIMHERLRLAWRIGGFIAIAGYFSLLHAT